MNIYRRTKFELFRFLKSINKSNKERIILLAHPRSGSCAIWNSLQAHTKINMINEPFERGQLQRQWPEVLKKKGIVKERYDEESLDKFLKILFQRFNSIKMVFGIGGTMPDHLNRYALSKYADKIIFLRRKNLLKTLISLYIAENINCWHSYSNKVIQEKIFNSSFSEISISKFKIDLMILKKRIEMYRNFLKEINIPFFEIFYEDIFIPDITINKKVGKINEILDFLGLNIMKKKGQTGYLENILDFKKRKQNSKETYSCIPNIMEIEKKFGSPENGFLFYT